ncbi:MAG TPA: hypothetical protein PLP50_12545 [Thermoanaerobaculia bacterium]|nr:hypothetical protein [Thermoanaerobaculia bacterium]HQN08858.1 hypothetical protein [Thermoanaerobaculia bacterium]HQP88417.1 hypothetical protein [Thermoanaerobaculia bacterium]
MRGSRTAPDVIAFLAVVAVQSVAWAVVGYLSQAPRREIVGALVAGASVGVPLGLGFDLVIGAERHVFGYRLPLTPAFLVANGALSYGLAIATVIHLWRPAASGPPKRSRPAGLLAVSLAGGLVAMVLVADPGLLAAVFLIGGAVVLAGEGLSLLLGREGPFAAVAAGRFRPAARLWLSSVALGVVYEAANALWPVWAWGAAALMPKPWWSVILVGCGYVVLFHPMWLLAEAVGPWILRRRSLRSPEPP